MKRLAPLLLLAGCTLAWTERLPDPPAAPPARALATRAELGWARDGHAAAPPDSWREALKDELLTLGTLGGDVAAPGSDDRTLVLQVDRELDTGAVSLALNLLSGFLWPHAQELRLRVTASLCSGDLEQARAEAEAALTLRTSLAFLAYPPAWWADGRGKLERPEVLEALRACLQRALGDLRAGGATSVELPPPTTPPPTTPPPQGARACRDCGRAAEEAWVACPWCGASLPAR